jgi:DNA invertase Pin-like site-specific DNA recombinase
MPGANTLTVGLFAVLAQHERETISKRTEDVLAAKKARGARLGNPHNLTPAITRQGQATMQRNAREHQANRQAAQLAELLRAKEYTLWEIAAALNAAGYRTRRGKEFHATTVLRLLAAPSPLNSRE